MSASSLKGLLCAFDPTRTTFALVSADNRLKIFDVISGKLRHQLSDSTHLTERYSCLAWGLAETKSRARSKAAKIESPTLVALGTHSGRVIIWDLQRGQVVKRLGDSGDGHQQKVNSIRFTASGVLVSVGDDRQIIDWNVTSGLPTGKKQSNKHDVQSLAIHDSVLAVASTTLKIRELESKKTLRKFTGHATVIDTLEFTPDGKYLLTASSEDRFLSVWDASTKSSSKTAVRVLSQDAEPVSAAMNSFHTGDSYHIATVSTTGVVSLFNVTPPSGRGRKKSTPDTPQGYVRMATIDAAADAGVILAATFTSATELYVARGSAVKPIFDKITYADESDEITPLITLQGSVGGLLIAGDKQQSKRTAASASDGVQRLGPADMPVADTTAMEVTPSAAATAADDEPSLAAQLKQLTVKRDAPGGKKSRKRVVPKAESLVRALLQALHSGDKALLEEVLVVQDSAAIRGTVGKLQGPVALQLLQTCVDKFYSRPNRAGTLIVWIRTLLLLHTGFLMSVPDLPKKLSSLYQVVDQRVSMYKKLLLLHGRLDLLLHQAKPRQAIDDEEVKTTYYNESDEDAPEAEDVMDGVGHSGDESDDADGLGDEDVSDDESEPSSQEEGDDVISENIDDDPEGTFGRLGESSDEDESSDEGDSDDSDSS
eukprot:TRINITY_DN7183_c0_g1_i1.p1 TRINITY_DN7183_c0_g1~~TRINITY_DN7183_c0_g1_i1.p1  ORF type:complete len:672 (-),score=158.70 TRINITY_DN7183_c0_g1_i1:18-1985(-)